MHTREKYVRVIEFLFQCIKKWSSIFFLLREISRLSFSDGERQPSPLVIELWKFSYTYLSFAFIWSFPCWLWLIAKKEFEIKHKFEIFLAKGELQSSLFWIQFQVIGICSCLFTVVVVFFTIQYLFLSRFKAPLWCQHCSKLWSVSPDWLASFFALLGLLQSHLLSPWWAWPCLVSRLTTQVNEVFNLLHFCRSLVLTPP